MARWSEPCCSSWSSEYMGLTDADPIDYEDELFVVGVAESQWPSHLGSGRSVLAVAIVSNTSASDGCTIVHSDMLFNAVNHTFSVDGSEVDLASVALHEFGHWLGLGHSSYHHASMYPSQMSGVISRTLHADDIDGVCSLYERDCSCEGSGDCLMPGEFCDAGFCVMAGCSSDAECAGDAVCRDGDCVREWADCTVCKPCTDDSDCQEGAKCDAIVRGDADLYCLLSCDRTGWCPGDSTCIGDPNGARTYCVNDNYNSEGICAESYVCDGDSLCRGVECGPGEMCSTRDGSCVRAVCERDGDCPYSMACVSGRCSLTGAECEVCQPCDLDSDCGDGGVCLELPGADHKSCTSHCGGANPPCPGNTVCARYSTLALSICINDDQQEAGTCPVDFRCLLSDPCAGVSCGPGQRCDSSSGSCVSGNSGAGGDTSCDICTPCSSSSECSGRSCVVFDEQQGGVCSRSCSSDRDCPGNAACVEVSVHGTPAKMCLNPDASSEICSANFSCDLSGSAAGPAGPSEDQGGGGSLFGCAAAGKAGADNSGHVLAIIALLIMVSRRRRWTASVH